MTAMAAQGRDIRLSEERVEGYRNFATKLWNATRYCEMNGCLPVAGFKPESVGYNPNKWIIHSMLETKQAIETAIEEYKFNEAAAAIYQFVWGTFCDWYPGIHKASSRLRRRKSKNRNPADDRLDSGSDFNGPQSINALHHRGAL
jgi:valyl-tRNA synthetase